MTERRAECSCGQLSVTCAGEPARVSVCHCLACKKRSGSAFAYGAHFPEDQITVAGDFNEWVRIGDDGGRITQYFCPTCGATVFYRNSGVPGLIPVAVGGFADPEFPAPTVSVYHESRSHKWLEIVSKPLKKLG